MENGMRRNRDWLYLTIFVLVTTVGVYFFHVWISYPAQLYMSGTYSAESGDETVVMFEKVSENMIVCLRWTDSAGQNGKTCAENDDGDELLELSVPSDYVAIEVSARPYFVFFHEWWEWKCGSLESFLSCSAWE